MIQFTADGRSEKFRFETTGREFYANCHIVGINPALELYEGYDGEVYWDDLPLTQPEREELADYMIGLWTQFKISQSE